MIFQIIWALVGFVILIIGIIYAGYMHFKNPEEYSADEIIFSTILIATTWPIVVICICGILPFYLLFLFGKWLAKRSGK